MDFNRVISSAYSWISLNKVVWFLVFFWISLPVILLLPQAIQEYNLFTPELLPIVFFLYDVLYLALIVGFIALTQYCLSERNIKAPDFHPTKLIDIVLLVFTEMYYIFVWNLHASFRYIQVLLLISTGLLYYYYTLVSTNFVMNLFALCTTAYFVLVIYNSVRLFFTTTLFCNKTVGVKKAVEDSWAMTHNKFPEAITSILLVLILVFVLFSFAVLVLGTITSLILGFFFINPVAVSLGFRAATLFALAPAIIAYHYAVTEVYSQLNFHRETSTSIKRILAHKVLTPVRKFAKKKTPARKLAKKQNHNKKRR